MKQFDAAGYWEERLRGGPSLDTVGWLGLGSAYNRWMYRVRAARFRTRVAAALRSAGMNLDNVPVLDVGSGSGFYIDLWQSMGARNLSGCDLTAAAVASLQGKYPHLDFRQADAGASLPYEEQSFDVISCMDVLFHIVDDGSFRRAFANLAALLRPGGLLIFTENFLHGDAARGPHQVSRTLREIEDAADAVGLEPMERRPVFVLMNTPVDSRNAALQFSWRALTAIARRSESAAYLAGSMLYPLELALTSVLPEGPSTEMMICRRAKV